jgi:hypothetical protein
MRVLCSGLLAATLSLSGALAAGDAPPLAPGKPAGVRKAQAESTTLIWLLGAGLVIGGIALVATNGADQTPAGSAGTASSTTTP